MLPLSVLARLPGIAQIAARTKENLKETRMSYDPLLTPRDASAFLGLSGSWLAKLRLTGGGPPFIKLGRQVRYRLCDLEAWLQAEVRSSTSDPGSQPFHKDDEGAEPASCKADDVAEDNIPF